MATATLPKLGTTSGRADDSDLHRRIRGEFAEMPGLKLTLPQAARLFHVEPRRCERVLGGLVNAGELASDGTSFLQAGSGRLSL